MCLFQHIKGFAVRGRGCLLMGNGDPGVAMAKVAKEHLAWGGLQCEVHASPRCLSKSRGCVAGWGAACWAAESTFRVGWLLLALSFTKFHFRPMFRAPVLCWAEPRVHGPCNGAGAARTLQGGKPLHDTRTPFLLSRADGTWLHLQAPGRQNHPLTTHQ